jgi:hypothetical protein
LDYQAGFLDEEAGNGFRVVVLSGGICFLYESFGDDLVGPKASLEFLKGGCRVGWQGGGQISGVYVIVPEGGGVV